MSARAQVSYAQHQRGDRSDHAGGKLQHVLRLLAQMMPGQEPLQPETDERTAEHAHGTDHTDRRRGHRAAMDNWEARLTRAASRSGPESGYRTTPVSLTILPAGRVHASTGLPALEGGQMVTRLHRSGRSLVTAQRIRRISRRSCQNTLDKSNWSLREAGTI